MNKSPSKARASVAGRQLIVSAARAHFFSHGFRRVTTDDLADQLGISKKTLLPATLGLRTHGQKKET